MKRTTIVLALLSMFALTSRGQITINEANMPFGPQLYAAVSTDLSSFIIPAQGTNQTWNYGSSPMINVYFWDNVAPQSLLIPGATFADTSVTAEFLTNTVYYTDKYFTQDASAIKMLGTVTKKQEYNISSMTGGANDSCKFPAQHWIFNNPYKVIEYPATMSSKWTSNYTDRVDFILNIPGYMVNNAPCYRVSHITASDTVVAWGTMSVPTLLGPSMPYDALMVKRNVVAVDSFYMNGSPASSLLLGAFGLSQGMQRVNNKYVFWRENSSLPIAQINFGANNFTTPTSVLFAGDASVGIEDQSEHTEILIYPNPASEFLYINGSVNSDIRIFDIRGNIVYSSLSNKENHIVSLSGFSNGTYIIKVSDKNTVVTRKVNVVR